MKKILLLLTTIILLTAESFSQPQITIALQPFTSFPPSYIDTVKAGIKKMYGNVTVKVLPEKKLPYYAFYKPRNRYRAEKILNYLDTLQGKHTKIIGLTTKDISTTKGDYPDWGIFGLGEINGKTCVVSTFRLKKKNSKRSLFLQRLVKVVNHELGHCFGFDHCPQKDCLMEDAKGTIKTVDSSDGYFCSKCKKMLVIILIL
jgi:archaemetzincin